MVQKAQRISPKCLEIMPFSYIIAYNELYVAGFVVILSTEYFVAGALSSGFIGFLLSLFNSASN